MGFILNIDNDTHRVLFVRLLKNNVKLNIQLQTEGVYHVDTVSHDDYVVAKQIQIAMDHEGYANVPVI